MDNPEFGRTRICLLFEIFDEKLFRRFIDKFPVKFAMRAACTEPERIRAQCEQRRCFQ